MEVSVAVNMAADHVNSSCLLQLSNKTSQNFVLSPLDSRWYPHPSSLYKILIVGEKGLEGMREGVMVGRRDGGE